MHLREKIVAAFIVISLLLPVNSYAEGEIFKVGYLGMAVILPFIVCETVVESISNMFIKFIKINGKTAVFQRNSLVRDDHGTLLRGYMVNPVKIRILGQDAAIHSGHVFFHENGNILKCAIYPATNLYIGDNTLVKCRGWVTFYKDGFVRNISEPDEQRSFTIQGKQMLLSEFSGSYREKPFGSSFYQDGKVEECILKNDEELFLGDYSVTLPKQTRIRLSPDHKLIYFNPLKSQRIAIKFKGEFIGLQAVSLHKNGTLKSCAFDQTVIENGCNSVPVTGDISFYDNERIETCNLSTDTVLSVNHHSIRFAVGDLSFYKNGNIQSGETASDIDQFYVHQGLNIPLERGRDVSFYEEGTIKSLYPAKRVALKIGSIDIICSDFSHVVHFYEDGHILSAPVEKNAWFSYHGRKMMMDTYAGRLFFNKQQELIAFTNDTTQEMIINDTPVIVRKGLNVALSEDNRKTLAYVEVNSNDLVFPDSIRIRTESLHYSTVIFVKAKHFFNVENTSYPKGVYEELRMDLAASDIQALMFSDDAEIEIDGRKHVCKAMQWINVGCEAAM